MRLCIILIIFLLPFQVLCKSLKLSAALTVEPYIIKANNTGFEVDIVREAFALEGYSIKIIYQPLRQTKISFKKRYVDGAMTVKEDYPEIKGAYLSNQYITYHNFVVTLKSRGIKIKKIADLADKNMIAFQQAKFVFGDEFRKMAKNNQKYKEMSNQESQIIMFFLNRTDAILLDYHIFNYYKNRLKNIPTKQSVVFHELFPASIFRMALREEKVRDAFNRGLRKIKKSGRYKKIIASYIGSINSNKLMQ
ncbi:MAG: amino acid ABC transporter substrate-binding protein [Desulfobacterales bacterium]|nr:amino acid ABC transporter substrate-binding protein [Desulfobacterales bacterium]MCP4161328.1 amino acid ABC transporter substrate-binding protein [Deltaproteobacteria bacterium]